MMTKRNVRKQARIRITAMILLAVLAVSSLMTLVLTPHDTAVFGEGTANSAVKVKIEVSDGSSTGKSDSNGYITYRIFTNDSIPAGVSVQAYYRTVNGSAIGGVDYESVPSIYGTTEDEQPTVDTGRVTLSTNNKSTTLKVKVNRTTNNTHKGTAYTYPEFYIELYAVRNGSVDSSKQYITCQIVNANHSYEYVDNAYMGSGYVFKDYTVVDQIGPYSGAYSLDNDYSAGMYKDLFKVLSPSSTYVTRWQNDFVNTDLAFAYVDTEMYISDNNGTGNITVSYSNDYTIEDMEKYQGTKYKFKNWYKFNKTFASYTMNGYGYGFNEYRTFYGITFNEALEYLKKIIPQAVKDEWDIAACLEEKISYRSYSGTVLRMDTSGGKTRDNYCLYNEAYVNVSAGNMLFVPQKMYNLMGWKTHEYVDLNYNYYQNGVHNTAIPSMWYHAKNANDEEDYSNAVGFFVQTYVYDTIGMIGLFNMNLDLDNMDTAAMSSWAETEHQKVFPDGTYPDKIFFQIPKGSLTIVMHIFSDSDRERQLSNMYTSFVLQDAGAPQIKASYVTDRNTGVGASTKDSTRVSIKFNEPVYVTDTSKVSIKAKLNNDKGEEVTLKYAGGSGTDTLYFDFDKSQVTKGVELAHLYMTELVGTGYICDYAFKTNHPSGTIDKSFAEVDSVYDYRIPKLISVTTDGTLNSLTPQKSQTMLVKSTDISTATGTLFYCWSTSSTAPNPVSERDKYTEMPLDKSTSVTQVTGSGMNGVNYLHVFLKSALGLYSYKSNSDEIEVLSASVCFDNAAPAVNNITVTTEGKTQHQLRLDLDGFGDNTCSALGQVYLLHYVRTWDSNIQPSQFSGTSELIYDINRDKTKNDAHGCSVDTAKQQFSCYISYDDVGITTAGWSYIGFYIVDAAGNSSQYRALGRLLNFTSKTSVSATLENSSTALSQISDAKVFDVANNSNFKLRFKLDSTVDDKPITQFRIASLTRYVSQGEVEDIPFPAMSQVSKNNDYTTFELTLNNGYGKPLVPGYYTVKFNVTYTLPTNAEGTADSNEVSFYIYDSTLEDSKRQSENFRNVKYDNGFVTKVFALAPDMEYSYLDSQIANNHASLAKTSVPYCTALTSSIFSSSTAAQKYVAYLEYQDIALLRMDDTIAPMFRDGYSYTIAPEDMDHAIDDTGAINPAINSYWIRYKSSSWEQGSPVDWVYYYYGDKNSCDGTIDINRILTAEACQGLRDAIKMVSTRICSNGYETYVHTEYTDDPNLDAYNTPNFNLTQIHAHPESVSQSITGVAFKGNLTYEGDISIYDNTLISFQGNEYVGCYGYTFKMNDARRVFYASLENPANIVELEGVNGSYNLKNLNESATKYIIYELSENGYYTYRVNMDRIAPTVQFEYEQDDGPHSVTLSNDMGSGNVYYAKSFSISEVNDVDDPDYSYVAIFRSGGLTAAHVVTRTATELRSGANTIIVDDEGTYYVQVFDRSGNMFTFTVQVRDDELASGVKVKVVENSYVQVNVSNRTLAEMKSYEVWLYPLGDQSPEELKQLGQRISTKFSNENMRYYDSGKYVITLIDRYGNTYEETVVFERTIPELELRYCANDGDPYSLYVEGQADQPIYIVDENTVKTVFTRAKIRFIYDSSLNYKYEFLTYLVEGFDYDVNDNGLTTTLTVSYADSFSVRFYHANYELINVTYNVVVDKNAPQIDVTYEKNEYEYDDKIYFEEQLEKIIAEGTYRENEYIPLTPSSIYFTKTGTRKCNVIDGSLVLTDTLYLAVDDESGIKNYKITRDNVLVSEKLNGIIYLYKNGRLYREITATETKYYGENGFVEYTVTGNVIRSYTNDVVTHVMTYQFTGDKLVLTENGKSLIYDAQMDNYVLSLYNDGKLYKQIDTCDFDIQKIVKDGKYTIQAEDKVGRISYLNFEKVSVDVFGVEVDGEKNKLVGNDSLVISINDSAELTYIVYSDGVPEYGVIRFEENCIRLVKYSIGMIDGDIGVVDYTGSEDVNSPDYIPPIFDVENGDIKPNQWYLVNDMYFMYISPNHFKAKIVPEQAEEYSLTVRVESSKLLDPIISEVRLSKKKSNVYLQSSDNTQITTNVIDEPIYTNKGFCVASCESDVTSVKVYYSATANKFSNYEQIFTVNSGIIQRYYSNEGYYLIEIQNIYGNITHYNVVLSETFLVGIFATYSDNTENFYDKNYLQDTVYSGKSVRIEASSAHIAAVNVLKVVGGQYVNYEPPVCEQQQVCFVIVLNEQGIYNVTLIDEYGNIWEKNIQIRAVTPTLPNNIIVGFNPLALRRNDNYTNTTLSIDVSKLDTETIKQISVCKDGKRIVLYDDISQEKIPFIPNNLSQLVGVFGDGAYDVVFRDIYGNSAVRTIHYSATPTLVATRKTRLLQDDEIVDDSMLQPDGVGLWTNSSYKLTGSPYGILTVDGATVTGQYVKDTNSSANELFTQSHITYIDEYGFSYDFYAYISRAKVKFDLAQGIKVENIAGYDYTNGNIAYVFDENIVSCTYTLNGGEEKVYHSGDILRKDGAYHFVATDIAGNRTTASIRRDTQVEFAFSNYDANRQLVNGEVVNGTVLFSSLNNDTCTLDIAVLDGEVVELDGITRFSQSGKWEFFIKDKVGNQTYFSFYIVDHPYKSFPYTTPYGYLLQSVTYNDGESTFDYTKTDEVKPVYSGTELIGHYIDYREQGTYSVVMKNEAGNILTFTFVIDHTEPTANLVNCDDGGITLRDVTFSDLVVGDTVEVYKEGKLVNSYEIINLAETPVVSDSGKYKVVIRSISGNEKEYNFTRKHVLNTAGNVLVITLNVVLSLGLFIGLSYRRKSKVDK